MVQDLRGVAPVAESDHAAQPTSPQDEVSTLQRELHKLIYEQFQLAVLEVQLAARSLMIMISSAICIGVLLVLVWVGLMGTVALGLIDAGLQPALALLGVSALTAIPALLLFGLIHHRSRDLGLPATLHTLKPSASQGRDGESS